MSTWRREALKRIPECRSVVEEADSPMALWLDLSSEFDGAVESGNNDLVRRILMYGAWCLSERSGRLPNDTSSAAWVGFFEDLPTKREYWPSFREWFYPYESEALLPAFQFLLSDEDFKELRNTYAYGVQ